MQHKAIIIIPVYSNKISHWEELSLRQCVTVLGRHHIVFMAPQNLDITPMQTISGIDSIVRFDDSYFIDVAGYNRLMLSKEFYERFVDFEYMLIYQLDAYVFSDRLLEWCERGYDYVGAPWIPEAKYFNFWRRAELIVYQNILNAVGIYRSRSKYFSVGNGGFSLRKIASFLEVIKSDEANIKHFLENRSYNAEDVYWGIKVNRIKHRFRIPNYKEAIDFAFENHPEQLYNYNRQRLPFGAHAWYKGYRLKFWRKFIPSPEEK
ncbi:DUF5672 family protein [Bacteroides sp.]|uniref:DUF5672 family protein n=1 Tax=Bacteroides sp. TaxID=29523 RepID=UPI0026327B58|nr:DUF5672 family protein [Bacteroides sp.]